MQKEGIKRKERMAFIDKACGIAILFVVYGHIRFRETDSINWYFTSKEFIYKFHMPLFMCLSGYVAFLSTATKNIKSKWQYLNFQKKKLSKFVPVYFLFALVSILADLLLHHATTDKIKTSVFYIFFSPAMGSAGFIWYLYVLFGFYLITPLLLNLKNYSLYLLFIFSFFLTDYSAFTALFSTNLFCKCFFFFLGGGLIYLNGEQFTRFLEKNGIWILSITLFITIIDFLTQLAIPYQLTSIAMILSVLHISNIEWPKIISEIFITIGVSSFAIYLLNTSFIEIYYFCFKWFFHSGIGAPFIFSCLIISTVTAILFRIIFNKIVPARIYSL